MLTNPVMTPAASTWTGDIDVLEDLFGFLTAPRTLSLLELARTQTARRINLNLIRVGGELFTEEEEGKIDLAVSVMRGIYAAADLLVGRVVHYSIPAAAVPDRIVIDDLAEAELLTEEWSFPDNAVDVFLVRAFAGSITGRAAVNGSCEKDRKGSMTGCVVAVDLKATLVGITLAHEVGHYLGLTHVKDDSSNLMFPDVQNGGQLTEQQAAVMLKHCFVYPGCR